MSQKQSRFDRIEASSQQQSRRYNRSSSSSGYTRAFPGGKGGGRGVVIGAGSSTPHPPAVSTSSSATSSSNRPSFQKSGYGRGSVQSNLGYQSRNSESLAAADRSSGRVYQPVQNVALGQSPLSGNTKPMESPEPRNAAGLQPKAPVSQPNAKALHSTTPSVPLKAESGPFALQFGTISPGFINGIQVPPRTRSAPPNLDEQKCNQVALYGPPRTVPAVPISTAPRLPQEQQTKVVGLASQLSTGEPNPLPSVRRDVHAPFPSGPPIAPSNPNVLPMAGIPIAMHMPVPMGMPMPFQHQQVQMPLQFGVPNPQIQPQAVVANPFQIPMRLSHVNAQPMFVPGHLFPQHLMMHQGQGLGFVPPLAPQLHSQAGNLGVGIRLPLPPQQPSKFIAPTPRKGPVKITHPETREELRLEKKTDLNDNISSRKWPVSTARSQSEAVSSHIPSHQLNYGSYAQPNFKQSQLTQIPKASQTPRYNYAANQAGRPRVPSAPNNSGRPGSILHGISEGVRLGNPPVSVPLAGRVQVTVKSHAPLMVEKVDIPLHVTNEELLKVKSDETVTTSHQSQSVASSDNPKQMSEGDSELLKESSTDVYNHLTAVPSVGSSRKAIAGGLSSATPISIGRSAISQAGHEYNRKEVAEETQCSNDNRAKPIKKDIRHLDQQVQAPASSFNESFKVSSPKFTGDTCTGGSMSHELSIDSENEQSLSARNSTPPLEVSSFSDVQQNSTVGAGSPMGVEDLGQPVLLRSSRELPDSKEAHNAIQVSSNAFGLATDIYGRESSLSVSSSSVLQSAETTTEKILDAKSGQNDTNMVDVVPEKKRSLASDSANKFCHGSMDDGHPIHSKEESSKTESPSLLFEKGAENHESTEETKSYMHGVEGENFGALKEEANYTQVEDRRAAENGVSFTKFNLADAETAGVYFDGNQPVVIDNPSAKTELTQTKLADSTKGDAQAPEPAVSHVIQKQEAFVEELPNGAIPATDSDFNEKFSLEKTPKPKTPCKKKNIKEILSKADAAGTSDLFNNAYNGRQEKKEAFSSETAENFASSSEKSISYDDLRKDISASDEDRQDKNEPDDWEDATDVSTSNPEKGSGQAVNGMKQPNEDSFEATSQRKYSREFLLTLSHQFIELPAGFQIGSDVADVLMISTDRESHPSSSRIMARSPRTSRADRCGIGNMDEGKWTKPPGSTGPGGIGNLLGTGISSGPLSQGLVSRSGANTDRWQRVNQLGLIPSPRMPMQVMHKAENKYEVGKVSDEEQAKQRQLKAILNKLTPQNFEKLFAQVAELNIDNAVTLAGVISQIFDKALMEPTFCEMYADFCNCLAGALPGFKEDNESITFKRLLLNKCQDEFERGEREQEEADKTEEEGGIKLSEDEREEKRLQARRRMLGNIRLIGELYKKKMLTERIMHECIQKLLGQYDNPDEENLEALCKLMSTIGQMIDHQRAKMHMDGYFEMMTKLSTNEKLSTRVRFLLRDAIDLRKNKWQERRKVEGPKKIEEVHRDAAQERQVQSNRLTRGGSVQRRGPAVDYGIRGSSQLISPSTQLVGGFRGLASQDVRSEERLQLESRTLPLPVRQKSTDDDTIALGPQGGPGNDSSLRGQPSIPNFSQAVKDGKRRPSEQNGNDTPSSWATDRPREEPSYRSLADRYSEFVLGESSQQHKSYPRDAESNSFCQTRDITATISDSSQASTFEMEDIELLQKKSLAALREFYSVKDEKEVALCISELNAPKFYPIMISFWIIDSFERRDVERNLLANLLVTLSNSRDNLFSRAQLEQGFENALSSLEDSVNDAPRAAEFLGRIFAIVVLEDIVPLTDIGRLIYEGGEEPGRLREIGLAAEVLGSILDYIKLERGISVLDQVRAGSNLALGDFLPRHRMKSKLDAFL